MSESMDIDDFSRPEGSNSPDRREPIGDRDAGSPPRDRGNSSPRRNRDRSPGRRDRSPSSSSYRGRDSSPRSRGGRRRSFDRHYDRRDSGKYRGRYDSGSSRYRDSRDYRRGPPPRDNRRFEDPERFSSNGAHADKTNRNYSNSIFIGNLPFDCSWRDLKDHFEQVGEVARADIVTSHGKSRGMGTVEFKSGTDVETAISKFNHTQFLNRDIFVRQDNPPPEKKLDSYRESRESRDSYSYRESRDSYRGGRDSYSSSRRDRYYDSRPPPPLPSGFEIFVGNLPYRTNWQDLKDLFREAGDVVHADVRLDDRGRSKGFGIVIFDKREEADFAIEKFNGYVIDGRKIDVRDGKNNSRRSDREERGSRYEPSESNKETTSDAPTTTEASEPADIEPEATEAADAATTSAGSEEETPFTSLYTHSSTPTGAIFIENLPLITTLADLYDLFEEVGTLVEAKIDIKQGRCGGSAFVEFETPANADVAIDQLNGYKYGGNPLRLFYGRRV